MKQNFKMAVFSLMFALAMPVMAQGTEDYLKPCDKPLPQFTLKAVGNLNDPDFMNQLTAQMNAPRSNDIVCWSTKVEPSFSESYEIQCVCNSDSRKCRLELKIQNQQEPHVLEIDEELAYQMRTLIDAAVYSATNLPSKQSVQQKLDILKTGEGADFSVAGLDGTTFRFFNRQYGAKCWSPRGGNNGALVAIGQDLYNAIAYKDVDKINSRLADIKSLARKYASLLDDPYKEYLLLRIDKKPQNWWWSEI